MFVDDATVPYRATYRFRIWTKRNRKRLIVPVLIVVVVVAGAFVFEALWQPHIAMESSASQANSNIYGLAYVTVWLTLTNTGQADGIATINLVVVHSAHPVVIAQERYLVPAMGHADFQLSAPWPFYLGSISGVPVAYPELVSVVKV